MPRVRLCNLWRGHFETSRELLGKTRFENSLLEHLFELQVGAQAKAFQCNCIDRFNYRTFCGSGRAYTMLQQFRHQHIQLLEEVLIQRRLASRELGGIAQRVAA